MKKIAVLLLPALFLLLPFSPAHAETAGTYARVTQSQVYLYESPEQDSGLFILPETYFVRITGEAGDYYAVEYMSATQGRTPVRGYCLRADVETVDYIPETPFLVYDTTVTFRTGEGMPDGFFTEYEVTAAFYGTFSYGSSVCYYVELEGKFGYVPASSCSPLSYPPNTEHTESETPPPADETPSSNQNGLLNVVLVCGLVVTALGALYFLFHPRKQKIQDEEDLFT